MGQHELALVWARTRYPYLKVLDDCFYQFSTVDHRLVLPYVQSSAWTTDRARKRSAWVLVDHPWTGFFLQTEIPYATRRSLLLGLQPDLYAGVALKPMSKPTDAT